MNKLAEEAFAQTGVAPSYGYLIMQIVSKPGMSQSELSKELNLMPSTMTRFIEKLDHQKLIRREHQGRMVYIYPTDKGKKFRCEIDKAFLSIYEKYKDILGEEFTAELTSSIYKANLLLER
jgi:DNA-binding MarR family transcriptional regulator